MQGYADVVALLLGGWSVEAERAAESPALLPAFFEAVQKAAGEEAAPLGLRWASVRAEPEPSGESFAVAVVDGDESEDDLEGLAEDAFIYEGRGADSVKVLLAPRDLPPDALLDALASFRAVVPAPAALGGRLAMPKAFLKAAGTPHAYGDDLSFLISQGAPEPQIPGHLRWTPYDNLAEIAALLGPLGNVTALTKRRGLPLRVPGAYAVREHGTLHRRSFLEAISAGARQLISLTDPS
jgi:hypothetical protein